MFAALSGRGEPAMRRSPATTGLSLILLSCASTPPVGKQETADQRFEALTRGYFEQLLPMLPEFATTLGDHRFDARLTDYRPEATQRRRSLDEATLKALQQIPQAELSSANQVDSRILGHQLQYDIFSIDVLREREWNPVLYNFGQPIYVLIAREFAPLAERLQSVKGRLEGLPAAVAQAKFNLKNPPRIHTETAILQNKGAIQQLKVQLPELVNQVPSLKATFEPERLQAIAALEDYARWLESDLLPRSTGDFRLGPEKYSQKLRFALESDLSKEEILRQARADLVRTQDEIYQVALPLYRQYFPSKADAVPSDRKRVVATVLGKLAEKHPTNETIVELAKTDLKTTTDFVRTKDLVAVPDAPLKVVVMPEFRRGVAVAYCDSPGPLEKRGETFFVISPTPSDWSPARVESFFREYNDYMVQDLTIHESMPGHYLQLAHSNQFKAPTLIRAIFRSGLFAEGWAVYTERVMAEQGYGGPGVRMQQLKMRLRMIINAMLDTQIHAGTMAEKEAMSLMMDEGFQEEGEAAGKWRRAALTSAQLPTYYVGNLEIERIARDYRQKHGPGVSQRQMHDAMLSFGTPAPKYVRELLGLSSAGPEGPKPRTSR
jgi:uncharacterized protein (DUF885 family)